MLHEMFAKNADVNDTLVVDIVLQQQERQNITNARH